MRLIGIFLTACVIFAALKAAIVTLICLFLVSLLWGLYLRPREVGAFLTYCTVVSLVGSHPTISLCIVGLTVILAQRAKNSNSSA